jgi:hypothetical protein
VSFDATTENSNRLCDILKQFAVLVGYRAAPLHYGDSVASLHSLPGNAEGSDQELAEPETVEITDSADAREPVSIALVNTAARGLQCHDLGTTVLDHDLGMQAHMAH